MKVKITTRGVGIHFGVAADVRDLTGRLLFSTEVYPLDCRSAARDAAVAWSSRHGHEEAPTTTDA